MNCRICGVFCFAISLSGLEVLADRDERESRKTTSYEQRSPMEVVALAEEIAEQYGIKPQSLLFLNLGSVFTQGSFTSNASVLSLRPIIPPRSGIHTGLYQALAANMKIIVVVSHDVIYRNLQFFASDFAQNIRHKFVFTLITRSKAQQKWLRAKSAVFRSPTIVLVARESMLSWNFKNRDNLFWESTGKWMQFCDSTMSPCSFRDITDTFQSISGILLRYYRLRIVCNVTRVEIKYDIISNTKDAARDNIASKSQWNIREERYSDCYSYVPYSAVDVTALMKPFDAEVWYLILGTVAVLTAAWTLILRSSALSFSSHLFLSIIAAREITLTPRSFSSAAIGCAVLTFTFLIGKLYSNVVMSSILDPTSKMSPRSSVFDCLSRSFCHNAMSLDFVLETYPACHIPPRMLVSSKRPMRIFRPINPSDRKTHTNFGLALNSAAPYSQISPLPLVLTQRSVTWDRILQHGVVSVPRLRIIEERHALESEARGVFSTDKLKLHTLAALRHSAVQTRSFIVVVTDLKFLSFNTTREWFDMSSFLKIQPLFGFCLCSVLCTICLELCHAKREWLIRFVIS